MIKFDDITREDIKKRIHISHKFLIIQIEYYYLEALNLKKQMHYLN